MFIIMIFLQQAKNIFIGLEELQELEKKGLQFLLYRKETMIILEVF